MSMIVTVLLVVANVLGAGMILPQVAKLHRTRSVDGLSGPWIGVGMAMNLWWAGYAIQGSVWGMLPVSIAGFLVYAVLAALFAQIVGWGAPRAVAVGALTFGMAPLPALLVGGWPMAGLAIGLCYGVQFLPAVVGVVRSVEHTGVARATWWMALIEAAIWLVYGLSIGDLPLIVGGTGGAAMSALILGRVWLVATRSLGAPRTASSYRRSVLLAGRALARR